MNYLGLIAQAQTKHKDDEDLMMINEEIIALDKAKKDMKAAQYEHLRAELDKLYFERIKYLNRNI